MRSIAPNLLLFLCACSDITPTSLSAKESTDPDPFSQSPPTGGADNKGGADAGLPPERELESQYEVPVATRNFVWVANPTSGRVAYIDGTTLSVKTAEAGDGPSFLASVPHATDDVALVLNVASADATLLRASGAALTTTRYPVARGANAWSVSADGHWAIALTDARKIPTAPKTQGFQDITVLDLTSGGFSKTLSVGYRPSAIAFSQDKAFAVTQDGVSVVALSEPRVLQNFPLSDHPATDSAPRDVSVTQNGTHAFVRREGSPDITAVDLSSGARSVLTLSGPVTDFDLSPKGDQAIAVVRDTSTVTVFPIPDAIGAPGLATTLALADTIVGSVEIAKAGNVAILYSNGAAIETVTALSLVDLTTRTIRVRAPALAAFLSEDGSYAAIVHEGNVQGGTAKTGAYSLIPLQSALPPKIIATSAPVQAIAFAANAASVIATVRGNASRAYATELTTLPSLESVTFPLASPPIATGILEKSGRAYVAQSHPDGRITFIDFGTRSARTLTGFELGARVVDGSKPQ